MKISIGADHRGFALKQALINHFNQFEWLDQGTHSDKRTDFPLFAKPVCHDVQTGAADFGILICGSGVGMSIAANRFSGIYAALCSGNDHVITARQHDNANVLVLAADFIKEEDAISWVNIFTETKFLGDRYQERLKMID